MRISSCKNCKPGEYILLNPKCIGNKYIQGNKSEITKSFVPTPGVEPGPAG